MSWYGVRRGRPRDCHGRGRLDRVVARTAVGAGPANRIGEIPMLYRCCFLDANDSIDAIQEIEADTLLGAIEQRTQC